MYGFRKKQVNSSSPVRNTIPSAITCPAVLHITACLDAPTENRVKSLTHASRSSRNASGPVSRYGDGGFSPACR